MKRKSLSDWIKLVKTALTLRASRVLPVGHQTTAYRHDKSCAHPLRCLISSALTRCPISFTVRMSFRVAQLVKLCLHALTLRMKAVQPANSEGLPVPTLPSNISLAMKTLKTF